ncbi:hypothetical protein Pcinc_007601 [Petrolisthes cinctipes]|uniref:Reverse transcriptase RNase H-like domain-containing protein n=1 Tax=Petrolisthes cinctipes TaxID=88211 RepID=A0AAE1G8Z5_PETCI|nr:hypothetical protein Pcinc_007601 [Petrolisthes cinctipes]
MSAKDGQTDKEDPRAQINPNLDPEQLTALVELLQEYGDIFSEIPGYTTTIEHDIILDTTGRIRSKVYPVLIHLKPFFEKEVEQLFEQDASLTFVLRTDASNRGLGAVLFQYHLGWPHPVAYASRKLLPRETKYSTIERECLAIIFGILRFDYYLRGKEFILEVDHKPLAYLQTSRGKNDRLLRWALNLQAYKFRVIHVAGADNIGADLLSRS